MPNAAETRSFSPLFAVARPPRPAEAPEMLQLLFHTRHIYQYFVNKYIPTSNAAFGAEQPKSEARAHKLRQNAPPRPFLNKLHQIRPQKVKSDHRRLRPAHGQNVRGAARPGQGTHKRTQNALSGSERTNCFKARVRGRRRARERPTRIVSPRARRGEFQGVRATLPPDFAKIARADRRRDFCEFWAGLARGAPESSKNRKTRVQRLRVAQGGQVR